MECPICHSQKFKSLGEKNSFEIIKCSGCKTLYAQRSQDSAENFDYSNYYREENLLIPDFVFETYRKIISDFEKHRINNRFLDVGCGAGTLLDIAVELSWDATGVEVSKPAAEHLSKRGLNVFHGTLEEANFPDGHFDVITCTEVIEHVPHPQELLNEIKRVLNPKGVLWMTTPHSQSFSGRLLGARWSVVAPPEHINLFSMKSMKMCLENAGFTQSRLITSGFNPFELTQLLRKPAEGENHSKNEIHVESPPDADGFERVSKSYRLNEWFVNGKNKQKAKDFFNKVLNKTNLGDTIKVWAYPKDQ